MAEPTSSSQEQRCYLLELPVELRLKIYEHLTALYNPDGHLVRVAPGKWWNPSNDMDAITRTNSQIRQESIPIIYGHTRYLFELEEDNDRCLANKWLKVIDPRAMESCARFILYGCKRCSSVVEIDLTDVEEPVKWIMTSTHCGRLACFVHCRQQVMNFVYGRVFPLEIVDGKRRKMTKEVLGEICEDLVEVVQGVLWGRSREN